jgi:hypothetical protein
MLITTPKHKLHNWKKGSKLSQNGRARIIDYIYFLAKVQYDEKFILYRV